MRRAKTSLRNSFFGWLAKDPAPIPEAGTEDIRHAMLHALEQAQDTGRTALRRKILFAGSTEALWYIRTDLMNAIAAGHGEAMARDRMEKITELFDGARPGGRKAR